MALSPQEPANASKVPKRWDPKRVIKSDKPAKLGGFFIGPTTIGSLFEPTNLDNWVTEVNQLILEVVCVITHI